MKTTPKVSIVTITYNHSDFLKEALDGFVMQKTNFDFEVVIADDASTDNTQEIIQEYSAQYPEIFKPILRKKNIGAVENSLDALRSATGEYVALCEGDDYWTDNTKLQLQANFLDNNQEYTVCFHPVEIAYEDKSKANAIFPDRTSKFSVGELLRSNFIQTNSVMYRRQDYSKTPTGILPLDWYLHLFHAQFGKIGFINKTMSVYRRHSGGIWWESDKNLDAIWRKHGLAHMALYAEMLKLCGDKKSHREIIYRHIERVILTLFETDQKYKENLLDKLIATYPDIISEMLVESFKSIEQYKSDKDKLLSEKIELKETILTKDTELMRIKASVFWKTRNKAVGLLGKEKI